MNEHIYNMYEYCTCTFFQMTVWSFQIRHGAHWKKIDFWIVPVNSAQALSRFTYTSLMSLNRSFFKTTHNFFEIKIESTKFERSFISTCYITPFSSNLRADEECTLSHEHTCGSNQTEMSSADWTVVPQLNKPNQILSQDHRYLWDRRLYFSEYYAPVYFILIKGIKASFRRIKNDMTKDKIFGSCDDRKKGTTKTRKAFFRLKEQSASSLTTDKTRCGQSSNLTTVQPLSLLHSLDNHQQPNPQAWIGSPNISPKRVTAETFPTILFVKPQTDIYPNQ